MEKIDTPYNEEAQKIVEGAERKASDSVAGREATQPELLDF